MKTHDIITELRDFAEVQEFGTLKNLLEEAADRLEELDERVAIMSAEQDAIALLKKQEPVEPIVRCKDCKHWDKTTREEGNDCILGPWEDAVCDVFQDWDSYGDLGENFRRTNGDWFCADGERR